MAGFGAFLQKYCKRKIPEGFRKAFRKDFSLAWIRKIPEGLRKDSPEGFSSRSMFCLSFFVFLLLLLLLVLFLLFLPLLLVLFSLFSCFCCFGCFCFCFLCLLLLLQLSEGVRPAFRRLVGVATAELFLGARGCGIAAV